MGHYGKHDTAVGGCECDECTDQHHERQRCEYAEGGDRCENVVVEGERYCSDHLSK
jgi:hypothetical protein